LNLKAKRQDSVEGYVSHYKKKHSTEVLLVLGPVMEHLQEFGAVCTRVEFGRDTITIQLFVLGDLR